MKVELSATDSAVRLAHVQKSNTACSSGQIDCSKSHLDLGSSGLDNGGKGNALQIPACLGFRRHRNLGLLHLLLNLNQAATGSLKPKKIPFHLRGERGCLPNSHPSRPRRTFLVSLHAWVFWLPFRPTFRAFPENLCPVAIRGFRPRSQLRGSGGFAPPSPRQFAYFSDFNTNQ
jgi:hypothetical protein